MKAPDKIYLQACGDCPGFDSCQSCKFDDLEEVTWSEEKVWEKDIPYIRKDALTEYISERKKYYRGLIPAEGAVTFICAYEEMIKHIESL